MWFRGLVKVFLFLQSVNPLLGPRAPSSGVFPFNICTNIILGSHKNLNIYTPTMVHYSLAFLQWPGKDLSIRKLLQPVTYDPFIEGQEFLLQLTTHTNSLN